MKNNILKCVLYLVINMFLSCESLNILCIFPHTTRSHHIYFSSLTQELASRNHNVTVINYLPMKMTQNLKQISLDEVYNNTLDINEWLQLDRGGLFDLNNVLKLTTIFKDIANSNCEKLVKNKQVQRLVKEEKFDVVILEQFVSDCGFAIAYQVNAPTTVGITAHVPMPWIYSRLCIPNPSILPNVFFASGTTPNLLNRIKGAVINVLFVLYYRYVIQETDNSIVRQVYPNTPDLEELGTNMSLLLSNTYFSFTGSRLQGANVVEVGGMHIKDTGVLKDQELKNFVESEDNDVVYISFGSKASNLPQKVKDTLLNVIRKSKFKFVWKTDDVDDRIVSENTLIRRWLPQMDLLCHPKVKVFITHSGMLSSSEAIHCGVPVVSIPLFGDQFANGKSAEEVGLGIMLDVYSMDETVLENAVDAVFQKRFQNRAKQLSTIWKDRPMSPLDTAVFWIEYVAKHKDVTLKPSSVDVPLYQYLMIDLLLIFSLFFVMVVYIIFKLVCFIMKIIPKKNVISLMKKKT